MPQSSFVGRSVSLENGAHHTWLNRASDGSLHAQTSSLAGRTVWKVEDAGSGQVFLVSPGNTMLGSLENGQVYTNGNRQAWERWTITPGPNGSFLVKSVQWGRHLGADANGNLYTHANSDTWEQWMVQIAFAGTTITLFNASHQIRVISDATGRLAVTKGRAFRNVWRVVDAGSGQVYLMNPNAFHLGSRPDGTVYTGQGRGSWERWTITRLPNGAFVLTSVENGRNLSANHDGTIAGLPAVGTSTNALDWEQWTLDLAWEGNCIALVSAHGTWVVVAPNGSVSAATPPAGRAEWLVEEAGNGEVFLVGPDGKQLGSDGNGAVYTHANRKEWERWILTPGPDDTFRVTSAAWNRHLGANTQGGVYTTTNGGAYEQWRAAKPSAPGVISLVAESAGAVGWIGFGYNQYPLDRHGDGSDRTSWREDAWQLTQTRVWGLQPALVRIPLSRSWFNPTGVLGQYTWSSPEMLALYQVYEFYRSSHIPVMSGLWNPTIDGGQAADGNAYASDDFATLLADMMHQLYVVKQLTNIRYFTPTNEPEGKVSIDAWSTLMVKLRQVFTARGLPASTLTGGDSGPNWAALAAERNNVECHSYEHHVYWGDDVETLPRGGIESLAQQAVAGVRQHDTAPVFMGEAGSILGSDIDWGASAAVRPSIIPSDFLFGLTMFDLAVQVARSGESGALAWALDGFDQNKDAGMWNISGLNGGWTLRPWYYVWQLFCRYFPAGISEPWRMSGTTHIRAVANKITPPLSPNNPHWTFAAINRGNFIDRAVTFKAAGWGAGTFDVYTYSVDSQGAGGTLPKLPAVQVSTTSLQNVGVKVTVPANSGVLLSSMDRNPFTAA